MVDEVMKKFVAFFASWDWFKLTTLEYPFEGFKTVHFEDDEDDRGYMRYLVTEFPDGRFFEWCYYSPNQGNTNGPKASDVLRVEPYERTVIGYRYIKDEH